MNIYLPYDKEKSLREYATAKGKSISSIVSEFIDSLGTPPQVEDSSQGPIGFPVDSKRCDMQYCMNQAIGKFRVTTADTEDILWLCEKHLSQAKEQGGVDEAR